MVRYANLTAESAGEVLWLRVNRPDSRNALSRATLAELAHACSAHASEPALKALVISGTGSRAFAAGGDLKELSAVRTAEQAGELFDLASDALDQVRRFPLPVVAALNGPALGGGAELALACDFRVAASTAGVGFIQARLNICSGFGGGADLMQRLGSSGALLHGLGGSVLDASAALAAGLVDAVAAEGEALEQSVARFLAPILRQKSQVIRAYKAMAIATRFGEPLRARRVVEREWFTRTWVHDDHWAAVEALGFDKPRAERV
ncbi:MAG: enoyl-CoA hydratase/isomerase family protein [Steroidobacteraceae bacterium]|nr:enoyl-CoA hydratase/isomerase family protein [Steroidobacteraceae bacterium]